ncbi:MAG: alpha/beta hydrolase [Acidimicrobiales bacterium]
MRHRFPSAFGRRLVAVPALALLLAGCATGTGAPPRAAPDRVPSTTRATSTTVPSTVPVAPIAWTPCNGDLQCGTLTVPLDYARPQGPTIGIALERHLAEDPAQRIGSLVINPGGPGVSGIDDFANELSALTPLLLDDFDIVTFDPRGVQRSDPVTCGGSPTAPPGNLPDPVPQTAAAQKALFAGLRQFGADCKKASGAILPFVGTVDVARDLERLRIALGDSGLTFMGQSYGTLIGEEYAALYPTHVRAMVLDSVIDPALGDGVFTLGQAEGFEAELGAFFAWCATTDACPWQTTADPTAAVLALLAQSRTSPAPAGSGRTAGPGELYNALLDGLYSSTDWPTLGDALAADAQGNGAPVVAMSNDYVADGSTNGADAAEAIYCLDHPVSKDLHTFAALAGHDGAMAPVFGPLLAWGQAACAVWPEAPTRTPGPVVAPGTPPILVIGTTNDPATPYAWAVSVAHQLSHGVLLTREGDGHVAYFYSACVRAYVQTYLLGGGAPPAGTVCTS